MESFRDQIHIQRENKFLFLRNLVQLPFSVDVTFAGLRMWNAAPIRAQGKFKVEIRFGELMLRSGPSSKAFHESVNFLDPFKSSLVVSMQGFYKMFIINYNN